MNILTVAQVRRIPIDKLIEFLPFEVTMSMHWLYKRQEKLLCITVEDIEKLKRDDMSSLTTSMAIIAILGG